MLACTDILARAGRWTWTSIWPSQVPLGRPRLTFFVPQTMRSRSMAQSCSFRILTNTQHRHKCHCARALQVSSWARCITAIKKNTLLLYWNQSTEYCCTAEYMPIHASLVFLLLLYLSHLQNGLCIPSLVLALPENILRHACF